MKILVTLKDLVDFANDADKKGYDTVVDGDKRGVYLKRKEGNE